MHRILGPLLIAITLVACGKKSETGDEDEKPATGARPGRKAPGGPAGRLGATALPEAKLKALARTEVLGFERTSDAANPVAAQPVYRGKQKNAKGYHAVVQVNVMGCEDCEAPTLEAFRKELPQRRDMMLPAIHKENPRLVYEAFGIDLPGGQQAHAIFTLSHVKHDQGSAAAHGLDVFLSTRSAKIYIQVWPRPETPGVTEASQEALAATFPREDLVATAKVFLAAFLPALP